MKMSIRNIIVCISFAAGMIIPTPLTAQMHRGGSSSPAKESRNDNRGNRPGSNNNNDNKRPGGNNNNNNGNNRPGGNNNRPGGNHNNNNGNSNRPGGNNNHNNNNGNNYRPGGNNGINHWPGDNNRPGNNNGYRPGNNRPDYNHGYRPGNNNYGYRPGGSSPRPDWSRPIAPPRRQYRPMHRPIPRPRIPNGYRPYYGAPVINSILGLTFGTVYSSALDYLYTKGYEIDGYQNNTVYLRNVREMLFNWPDATLYYNGYGRLSSAQFVYSTSYYDTGRYDRLYDELCRNYGSPVSSRRLSNNGYEIMWYGGDSRGYVTVEYDYSGGRYYTVLSYGN